jgi:hypothetical protein
MIRAEKQYTILKTSRPRANAAFFIFSRAPFFSGWGSTPALGRCRPRLAARNFAREASWTLEIFWSARVFREGAENCARGGRAPADFWGVS